MAQTRQSLAAAEGATVEARAASDRHEADAERKAAQISDLERELSAAQALVATGKEAGRRVEALVGELAVARDRRTHVEGELQTQRQEAAKLAAERDALAKTIDQGQLQLTAFKRELQHTEARLKSEVEAARADAKSKARDANQLRLRLDDAGRKIERAEDATRLVRRSKGLQSRARELEARCEALARRVAQGGDPVVTRKPQQAPQPAPQSAPRAAPRKKGLVLMGSILDRVGAFDGDEPQKVATKPGPRPAQQRSPLKGAPAQRPSAQRPPAQRPPAQRPAGQAPPRRRPAPPKSGRPASARPAGQPTPRPRAADSGGRPAPQGKGRAPRDPVTGRPATRPKPPEQGSRRAAPKGRPPKGSAPPQPGPRAPRPLGKPGGPPPGKRGKPPAKPKRPPRSN